MIELIKGYGKNTPKIRVYDEMPRDPYGVYIVKDVGLFAEGYLVLENSSFVTVQVGEVRQFGGVVAPDGWLLCDGSEYLVEDYPALADFLGYGEEATVFNVPDYRECAFQIRGDNNATTIQYDGVTYSQVPGMIERAGITSHTHTWSVPAHTHSISLVAHNHSWTKGFGDDFPAANNGDSMASGGSNSKNIYTGQDGTRVGGVGKNPIVGFEYSHSGTSSSVKTGLTLEKTGSASRGYSIGMNAIIKV